MKEAEKNWAEQLVNTYADALLRMCALYLGDVHLAQDACQEAFVRAWEKRHTFRRESSEKTWLFHIAANVCRDMLRSAHHRHMQHALPLEENASLLRLEQAENTAIGCLLRLPEKYRLPLMLYYLWNVNTGEIARVLRLPLPTVLTRLRRGREKLRVMLEGEMET